MRKIFFLGIIALSIFYLTINQPALLPTNAESISTDNQQLIRFHVIANSDSQEDQALKRRVRDKVVQAMHKEFSQANNYQEAKTIALTNLSRMEGLAKEEIKSSRKNYKVTAQLGEFPFPTKTYGKLTLPAGNYQAVRITIGQGKGQNWWCVLFPPLCFVDITRSLAANPALAQSALKAVGTSQEKGPDYESLTIEQGKIEIRFKTLEILKSWF